MIIHHEIIQGSPEWHKIRAGKFTASTIPALFMKPSTKGYQDLIKRIARERKTGTPVESFKSEWMQRGNDLEGEALRQYELDNFVSVERVGFVEMSNWVGCSPDGLVGSDGLVQVKCPKWNTFFDIDPENGKTDPDYIIQCEAELLITGRKWNDLYYYDQELEPKTIRIQVDERLHKEIIERIEIAIPLVEELMENIKLKR